MNPIPASVSDLTTRWSADVGGVPIHFGEGRLEELGGLVRQAGARRPLIVTDGGLVRAGHVDRLLAALRSEDVTAGVFDGVGENPTTQHVAAGVEEAKAATADLLIALGGGSAMDCAKGINFLLTNGGRMEDYWGRDKATRPMLPSFGVPTTAGTGSEAQSFALISQPDSHRKMACGDRKARFRAVILDPQLVATIPRSIAAIAAIDAVAHAVESYVTLRRNPVSQLFAREAWGRLERSFEPFLNDPKNLPTGGEMLLAAHLAGAAIEASMLGAAHACANPLTARYGIAHGVAVGLMLPHVVRFNAPAAEALYGDLAEAVETPPGENGSERLVRRLEELRAIAEIPPRLRDCGVDERRLEELARAASEEWTVRFNPRPVDVAELRRLYESAY